MPGVRGRLDRCPVRQGGEVIRGMAPAPSLMGTGLRLSMASSLDGVTDVMVIVDLVACGGTSRRKVVPSLLPRLGTPGPRPAGAVIGGIAAASCRLWGMSIRAPLLVVAVV
jgi:hypothetical protein